MDHVGILKRAWQITWRYKALWILGLFAGSAGGSGGGGRGFNSFSSGSGSGSGASRVRPNADQFVQWVQAHLVVLVMVGLVLLLVGILLWALSIAAKGGLVWLSNEAADEREVRAGRGWRAGFHYWGRTFLIGLLLALPLLAILLVITIAAVGLLAAGDGLGTLAHPAAAAGSVFAICGVIGIAFVVFIPVAIVVGLLTELALRHGVLDDMHPVAAIRAAWWDLRNRVKDVLIMWLLLLVTGFVYGIVAAVVLLAFVLPSIFLFIAGAWPIGTLLIVVAVLVLLVPNAIYNTFYSTSWTVFFRRLTGREIVPPPIAAPAYAGGYATPGAYPPPPPAYPPAPPAPPQPPAPPVPGEQPPSGT